MSDFKILWALQKNAKESTIAHREDGRSTIASQKYFPGPVKGFLLEIGVYLYDDKGIGQWFCMSGFRCAKNESKINMKRIISPS